MNHQLHGAAFLAGCFLTPCIEVPDAATGREYHVSPRGDDENAGTSAEPLHTISAAAARAQAGDVITVHRGVYRERIDPPRGGASDEARIVYRAAPGERAVIKGSEIVTGWTRVGHDTWRVSLPDSFFGDFNPYQDLIAGDWFNPRGREHHTGAVYLNGDWLTEAATLDEVLGPTSDTPLWIAEVDGTDTTIWAQFEDADPNQGHVEINVRQAVFYPEEPGRNFITVRGFTMEHAATPWAPPTAEQIGLIGTHWSKGWVIEDNTIRYSTCVGVTLGKHGDEFDNTSQNSATGYVETIERGLANGWSKANIGHHVVRRNHISHCEQAGIVGSLGPVFCTVTDNEIHDIHVRRLFSGAEMAGIKFHAAIDTVISRNHIYRCCRGIWLDWMTQGTHVSRNLLHDNGPSEDLFVEVNHGPFLVDHNVCLSESSLLDVSEGGAYAHNLFAGRFTTFPELRRETPWQVEHGTEVAGLVNTKGGDNRFYNNVLIAPAGLDVFDATARPNRMSGNVFLHGAAPSTAEPTPVTLADFDPGLRLRESDDGWCLEIDRSWPATGTRKLVTTELLGEAVVTGLPYVLPDGSPHRLDTGFRGVGRDTGDPFPGPFAAPLDGERTLDVWPIPVAAPNADRDGGDQPARRDGTP